MRRRYPNNIEFSLKKDALWILVKPLKVISQNSASSRGSNSIITGDIKISGDEPSELVFLAPMSYSENTIHTWENYDSLGSRLLGKGKALSVHGGDIKGFLSGIKNGTIGGNTVTKKLDTPIAFTNSNRREYIFVFQLIDEGNPEKDVFEPVRLLQKWSCAEMGKTIIDFKRPYIFTLKTLNSKMIYVKHAALESVQPTYYGPYRNGYPSKCELSVTFKDLEPLYRKSWIYGR